MLTGRRVVTRSMIEGLNQDKSTVSCVNRRVLHMLKPEHTAPGTPVVGYRWSNIDKPIGLSQKALEELVVLVEVFDGVGVVGAWAIHELVEVVR